MAECVPIGAMEFDKLVAFAKEKSIDFTIVGMDDPLVGGIVDVFEAEGLKVFGPRKNAAILEGSKAFSKDLMKKYHIPTAAYENFTDPEEALKYLETAKMPIVLKADGLALGKGVLICNTLEEAKEGVRTIMEDKKFGNAGNTMVIEEFMTGREVSVLTYVDGKTIRIMSSAQDHKRAKDGDQGLNTGGMGNFSPSPFYTKEVDEFCKKYIYQPTVDAMAAEGRPFTGVIFFGLMLTGEGPKVLEYNARFGDPEAQVVLPRMKMISLMSWKHVSMENLTRLICSLRTMQLSVLYLHLTDIRFPMRKDSQSADLKSSRARMITSVSMQELHSIRKETS